MTVYFPDISGYQAGIDLAGALVAAIKVTESTNYLSTVFPAQLAEARHHGAFPVAYHFLHGGNAAAQADWCHTHAAGLPVMLDVESTSGLMRDGKHGLNRRSHLAKEMAQSGLVSRPGIGDMTAFIDRYRALGGVVYLVYLPHWYWQSIGSPSLKPLTDRGIRLWSSAYTGDTDASTGTGWQSYGEMTPDIWQYTSTLQFGGQTVDFSAFRGSKYAGKQDDASVDACLAEFRSPGPDREIPAAGSTARNVDVPAARLRARRRGSEIRHPVLGVRDNPRRETRSAGEDIHLQGARCLLDSEHCHVVPAFPRRRHIPPVRRPGTRLTPAPVITQLTSWRRRPTVRMRGAAHMPPSSSPFPAEAEVPKGISPPPA